MTFAATQRGVARAMALALALALAVLVWVPRMLAAVPAARLWAIALLVPGASLAFAIGRVAAARFAAPDQIAGGGLAAPSPGVAVRQALLQNTLEQVMLALPAYLGAAFVLPAGLRIAATSALLFGIGRILFFLGYARGAAARAPGFALTFYPSCLLLGMVFAHAFAGAV